MKFKVGDRVVLKSHGATNGFEIGDICIINDLKADGFYKITIKKDGVIGFVNEDNIELAKPFTKDDLRNGDIVILRNGEKLTVRDDTDFLNLSYDNVNNVDEFDDITDDLKNYYDNEEYDIVKVERPVKYDTVYERTEQDKKEMTIAEIEKELGYGVKIIKEDK